MYVCMYVCILCIRTIYGGSGYSVCVVVYVNTGICMVICIHVCMQLLLRMLHVENNALIFGLCVDLP